MPDHLTPSAKGRRDGPHRWIESINFWFNGKAGGSDIFVHWFPPTPAALDPEPSFEQQRSVSSIRIRPLRSLSAP